MTLPENPCGVTGMPALDETVDDMLILFRFVPIEGDVVARAGWCAGRDGGLPVFGIMEADPAKTNDPALVAIYTHQVGHALGFGNSLWAAQGLLADPACTQGTTPACEAGHDPHFTGAQALAAFAAIPGSGAITTEPVPVEDTGGPGVADNHWREAVLGAELMTSVTRSGIQSAERAHHRRVRRHGLHGEPGGGRPAYIARDFVGEGGRAWEGRAADAHSVRRPERSGRALMAELETLVARYRSRVGHPYQPDRRQRIKKAGSERSLPAFSIPATLSRPPLRGTPGPPAPRRRTAAPAPALRSSALVAPGVISTVAGENGTPVLGEPRVAIAAQAPMLMLFATW